MDTWETLSQIIDKLDGAPKQISIGPETHQILKFLAFRQGVTLKELIKKLLENWLKINDPDLYDQMTKASKDAS